MQGMVLFNEHRVSGLQDEEFWRWMVTNDCITLSMYLMSLSCTLKNV